MAGTLVHYGLMATLMIFFLFDAVLATTIGAVFGALINYLLNYFYTFQSKARHHEAFIKFWLIASLGFGINGGIVALSEHSLNIDVVYAQLAATVSVFIFTFFMNRLWTF